jgi:hypothetical protein
MTPSSDGNTLRVYAREAAPSAPQGSTTQAEASAPPIGELIVKGPPRQYRAPSQTKWIVLGGVLILPAAAGAFAWFQTQRRATFAAAVPRKERPPEGFEMREPTDVPDVPEPAGHGPDTVLDA